MFAPLGPQHIQRRHFGRRQAVAIAAAVTADRERGVTAGDDVKLFALNFLAGLVFMGVYLA